MSPLPWKLCPTWLIFAPGGAQIWNVRLRPIAVIVCLLCFASAAFSQATETESLSLGQLEFGQANFSTQLARTPAPSSNTDKAISEISLRLPEPRFMLQEREVISRPILGDVSVFRGEHQRFGKEGFQVGTALTRGSATAGLSLSYEGSENTFARSDIFIDYAINDAIRIGVTGTVNVESDFAEARADTLGISASYATSDGTYFQGSIADAAETQPLFGLAVGLRF